MRDNRLYRLGKVIKQMEGRLSIAEPRRWTQKEDRLLHQLANRASSSNWDFVASHFEHRSAQDCATRWQLKHESTPNSGAWSASEDEALRQAVSIHGSKWTVIAALVKTRTADQCIKRWNNALKPGMDHGPWTTPDDETLIAKVQDEGRSWRAISESTFPNRTPLALKNRYSLLQRRQIKSEKSGTLSVASSYSKESFESKAGDLRTNEMASHTAILDPSHVSQYEAIQDHMNELHLWYNDQSMMTKSAYQTASIPVTSSMMSSDMSHDLDMVMMQEAENLSMDMDGMLAADPSGIMYRTDSMLYEQSQVQGSGTCTPQIFDFEYLDATSAQDSGSEHVTVRARCHVNKVGMLMNAMIGLVEGVSVDKAIGDSNESPLLTATEAS